MTTGQWLRYWLASRVTPRYSTICGYTSHARLYLEPCLGTIPLARFKTPNSTSTPDPLHRDHQ